MASLVNLFTTQDLTISLIKLKDFLKVIWFLSCQSTLPQKREDVVELVLPGVLINIPKEIILREHAEWVFSAVANELKLWNFVCRVCMCAFV